MILEETLALIMSGKRFSCFILNLSCPEEYRCYYYLLGWSCSVWLHGAGKTTRGIFRPLDQIWQPRSWNQCKPDFESNYSRWDGDVVWTKSNIWIPWTLFKIFAFVYDVCLSRRGTGRSLFTLLNLSHHQRRRHCRRRRRHCRRSRHRRHHRRRCWSQRRCLNLIILVWLKSQNSKVHSASRLPLKGIPWCCGQVARVV